ncbi:glutamate ABC transporter substrate-binding protein [Rugosimonospora acidiphila]|uniref:Glutamate ABC transporter substrate-binding protein n=1 Tax=Rugosimonospora acidiphila TaxID=556531 RepID=A0ABP9RUZ3_9ACTN
MSSLKTKLVPRKSAALAAVAAATVLAVAACGGGSGSSSSAAGSTSNSGLGGSGVLAQSVYDSAPVAPASAIPAGSTMAMIKQKGQLTIGAALDAPLLSQQDPTNGKIEGFDADLAKLLAKYITGTTNVKTVTIGTQTREAMLSSKQVDAVFNTYTITPERASQVAFAGPYMSSGLAVAVKSSDNSIHSVKDLSGKTVIVGANTPAITELPKAAPNSKQVAFGTDPEAVQALTQGRGVAYVQDLTLLASDAKANPAIKVVGQPFTSEPYGIGLNHDDAQFKTFVNNWLKTIESDGIWAKVYQATLGSVVQGPVPTPPAIGSVDGS